MKEVCLVVPSIRENSIKQFCTLWEHIGLFDAVDLMLVEDNPDKTFVVPQATYHYTWRDVYTLFKDHSWIIPRRSDTVRSFGYYMAHLKGYKYILTLDDDCYPPTDSDDFNWSTGDEFVKRHIQALENRTKWFNTLNSVKPRGIPYFHLGRRNDIVLNHGLWTNVLDYDAPTQLANPTEEIFSDDNKIVPAGSYFPMCGMNVMWKRRATVLMYHLLMGQWHRDAIKGEIWTPPMSKLEKLPFDRFGDIWAGIFMKKIVDDLGYSVTSGTPYIHHERASNPFTNLKKEANGLEVNEKLWQYVDSLDFRGCSRDNFSEAYWMLGDALTKYDEFPDYTEYFGYLGSAMRIWADMFAEEE